MYTHNFWAGSKSLNEWWLSSTLDLLHYRNIFGVSHSLSLSPSSTCRSHRHSIDHNNRQIRFVWEYFVCCVERCERGRSWDGFSCMGELYTCWKVMLELSFLRFPQLKRVIISFLLLVSQQSRLHSTLTHFRLNFLTSLRPASTKIDITRVFSRDFFQESRAILLLCQSEIEVRRTWLDRPNDHSTENYCCNQAINNKAALLALYRSSVNQTTNLSWT